MSHNDAQTDIERKRELGAEALIAESNVAQRLNVARRAVSNFYIGYLDSSFNMVAMALFHA